MGIILGEDRYKWRRGGQTVLDFYEFFAGGGMVRAGLGAGWRCRFANDIDQAKARSYVENWGDKELCVRDVNSLEIANLPGRADLAWASFPCQDLSLAGNMRGMHEGTRSGVFWGFWRLMTGLSANGREPWVIALENVVGWLRANQGRDFAQVCELLTLEGYQVGAVVIDAASFVPQSRPRVFMIAAHRNLEIPKWMQLPAPDADWAGQAVVDAYRQLSPSAQARWVWWRIPRPFTRDVSLEDIIENGMWDDKDKTEYLLSLMDPTNRQKVQSVQADGVRRAGTVYRRVRPHFGGKTQRAEVRFDGIAGCLRTPSGGSSRQTILVVEGKQIHSRLLTIRETARLMGLPDSYKLPARYNDGYHLTGDGVAVPAVRHIAEHIFEPLIVGKPISIVPSIAGKVSKHRIKTLLES